MNVCFSLFLHPLIHFGNWSNGKFSTISMVFWGCFIPCHVVQNRVSSTYRIRSSVVCSCSYCNVFMWTLPPCWCQNIISKIFNLQQIIVFSFRYCIVSTTLVINSRRPFADLWKWMSVQSCLNMLLEVKPRSDRVGPLIVVGLINDSMCSGKWKAPSNINYQVCCVRTISSSLMEHVLDT